MDYLLLRQATKGQKELKESQVKNIKQRLRNGERHYDSYKQPKDGGQKH